MSEAEIEYREIAAGLVGTEQKAIFGKPSIALTGKHFACFFQDCMVFKLSGDDHAGAMALEGAQLFDPSGKHRPMKEWVQVPFAHRDRWAELAERTLAYARQTA